MRSFSGWLWSGRISGRLIITNGHKCRQDKTVYTTQQVSEDVLILAACPVTVMRLTTCLLSSPGEWERPSGADPVYDLLMSWNGSHGHSHSHSKLHTALDNFHNGTYWVVIEWLLVVYQINTNDVNIEINYTTISNTEWLCVNNIIS